MPWKILIADDEPLIRESLGDLVPPCFPTQPLSPWPRMGKRRSP